MKARDCGLEIIMGNLGNAEIGNPHVPNDVEHVIMFGWAMFGIIQICVCVWARFRLTHNHLKNVSFIYILSLKQRQQLAQAFSI